MRVALTGATGFIGSHVLAELQEHGHEVTALVRDDTQADVVAARGVTPTVVAGVAALLLVVGRRLSAGIREDLATGAPAARVLANRVLFDRSELQERGLVAI